MPQMDLLLMFIIDLVITQYRALVGILVVTINFVGNVESQTFTQDTVFVLSMMNWRNMVLGGLPAFEDGLIVRSLLLK